MRLRVAKPVLGCGIVLALVCLLDILGRSIPQLDLLQRLESMTYDWRLRHAATYQPQVATNLGFVFISDESIEALGDGTLDYQVGLYWPRFVYGHLTRELAVQGAQAVGFDILFANPRPDQTLPQDSTPSSSDLMFAAELHAAGNVLLAANKGLLPLPLFRTNALAVGSISVQPDADGILRRARAYEDYYLWHPLIRQAARLRGFDLRRPNFEAGRLTFPSPDQDDFTVPLHFGDFDQLALYEQLTGTAAPRSVARYQPPATPLRAWDLGLAMAAHALGMDLAAAKIEPGRILLEGTNGVRRTIPVDEEGCFYIDWAITPFHPQLTRESIESLLLQDRARRSGQTEGLTNRWAGKLAVVGSVASGNDLTDLGATPLEKETYLASRYLNVANSLLLDRFIKPLPAGLGIGLCAVLCAAAGFITWSLRPAWAALATVAITLLYLGLAVGLHLQSRIWIPVCLPLSGLILCHFSLLGYRVLIENQEHRRVRAVFSKIVSPNVVTELLKQDHLPLKGARRHVSVLFADVRGFTPLTDQAHAEAVCQQEAHHLNNAQTAARCDTYTQQILDSVNLYLSLIANIIKQNDGTLDKYIGDCVMAFWGAPSPQPRHALAAVQSAIAVQQAIQQLNQERQAENKRRQRLNQQRENQGLLPLPALHLLNIGIGINTGDVIAGLMGSREHILNYTIFGREVNLASRLESLTPPGEITIGEATYTALQQHAPHLAARCSAIPKIQVKGFRQSLNVYQVVWADSVPLIAAA